MSSYAASGSTGKQRSIEQEPPGACDPASHPDRPVVVAKGIERSYRSGRREVTVLRGLDLEVRAGEVVAIMGPSGCGKSTLLNCLSGIDRPDRGVVSFEGEDLMRRGDRALTELRLKRMGFVFQGFNLIPVLSVLANVRLSLELARTPRHEAEKRARATLAAVGLEGFDRREPSELSGGEQQRVAIARALVNGPAVVWADEPTGSLDSGTGRKILDLFAELNRQHGTTFVVVTHDPAVAHVADRILRMDSGRIVGVETP